MQSKASISKLTVVGFWGGVAKLEFKFFMQFSITHGQPQNTEIVKNALSIDCLPSVSLKFAILLPFQRASKNHKLQKIVCRFSIRCEDGIYLGWFCSGMLRPLHLLVKLKSCGFLDYNVHSLLFISIEYYEELIF